MKEEAKPLSEVYEVGKEAKSYLRVDMHVWQLNDDTWRARPDQWPMLEARSMYRDVAILGCIEMIEADYRLTDDKEPVEKRRYEDALETGTSATTYEIKRWQDAGSSIR